MSKKITEAEIAAIQAEMAKSYPPSSDFLHKLKIELAVRKDNEHVGTGMGGDPAQLYYLMTHKLGVEHSPDNDVHISLRDGILFFAVPPEGELKAVREELNKFWVTCPDKKEITQEQLANPSFLRDQGSTSIEVFLLIRALDAAKELVVWLDREDTFSKEISSFFQKEFEATEEAFLKEMGLPTDYFKKVEEARKRNADNPNRPKNVEVLSSEPMHGMMKKHPVWGKRWSAIQKRKSDIIDALLSQEDLDKLNTIGSLPPHLAMFVVRSIVQIDRLVCHNLDEKVTFLAEINKQVEELGSGAEDLDPDLE